MKCLKTGDFFGRTDRTILLDGITLTDTEYTIDKVDWHYHENAYFTFILAGQIIEINKKEEFQCSAGTLLFHNCQEPHYNVKPKGFTRGFHIELQKKWFDIFSFDGANLQGSRNIENPDIKILFHTIHKETKILDSASVITIQSLLLQLLGQMMFVLDNELHNNPAWISKLKEILHARFTETITLEYLSNELNIHPVYLSRIFPKYFNCTLGNYIRKIKIEKSLVLLSDKNLSLTDIAYDCGFADQSHFLRCFKKVNGMKPSEYRKLIQN